MYGGGGPETSSQCVCGGGGVAGVEEIHNVGVKLSVGKAFPVYNWKLQFGEMGIRNNLHGGVIKKVSGPLFPDIC